MSMKPALKFAGIGAICVSIATLSYLTMSRYTEEVQTTAPDQQVSGYSQSKQGSSALVMSDGSVNEQRPADPTTPQHPLQSARAAQRFQESKNLYLLVEQLRADKVTGAVAYEAEAMERCIGFIGYKPAYDGKGDSKNFSRKIELARHWQERCQNFTERDLRRRIDYDAPDYGDRRRSDDYIAINRGIDKVDRSDRAAKRAFVRQWLAIQDPFVIDRMASKVLGLSEREVEGRRSRYWFDGKLLTPDETFLYQLSVDLFACYLGMVCDKYEGFVAQFCIELNQCFDSRFDYIRLYRLGKGAEQEYKKVMNYAERAVAAIRRQDVDVFFRPDHIPEQ